MKDSMKRIPMRNNRIYSALILNDYEVAPYATWFKEGKKKIETRMKRTFKFRGDLVICCGSTNSVSENAGKALCIVDIYAGGPMKESYATDACIEFHPMRQCLFARNWRYFSQDWNFSPYKISGTWQGIFQLQIPDGITIIPQPQILPHIIEPEGFERMTTDKYSNNEWWASQFN